MVSHLITFISNEGGLGIKTNSLLAKFHDYKTIMRLVYMKLT